MRVLHTVTGAIAASLALAAAPIAVHAAGSVQVAFVQPERFSDAGDTAHERSRNLDELGRALDLLAARHLAAGQTLRIDVLDVDLAGEPRLSNRAQGFVRVLRGRADVPRITLRYALDAAGQPARTAERTVTDLGYLQRAYSTERNEPLHFEKRMLDDWFVREFTAAQ